MMILRTMGENTVAMMKDAINAFVNEDIALAQLVCDRDDIVDEAGDKILKDLTDVMKGKKDIIPRALALMRIAHNLERIADLVHQYRRRGCLYSRRQGY